jgi:asparagine synthase (glutamine-hydrolysing)
VQTITNTHCHDLTVESVISRTISDVPFGVLFSGGVDSSIIASTISSHSLCPCNTFTIGYDPKPSFDESDKAEHLSSVYGTIHHQLTIQGVYDPNLIAELVSKYDTPLSDWVNLPLYLISRFAKQKGISVLLSGEGADELFLGYPAYFRYILLDTIFRLRIHSIAQLIPTNLRQTLFRLFPSTYYKISQVLKSYSLYGSTFISNSLVFSPHDLSDSSHYLSLDLSKYRCNQPTIRRIRNTEFNIRLPELLLMRIDSMTMLNSVEARVPFLSSSLLNTILPQRISLLAPFLKPKYLLKCAFRYLPPSVLFSKKTGFGTPVPDWFKGTFKTYICSTILKLNSSTQLFHLSWLNTLISNSDSPSLFLRTQSIWKLWTLFILFMWYDSLKSLPAPQQ